MASVPKIHQGFGQIFEWDNKKGHLDKWWFYENDKFGTNVFKVWQKLKQDDKRGMSIIVGLTKMTFCETYRRIWQGLRQWDNKTVILTVGDFYKNGKSGKMGNWVRIHPVGN